MKYIVHVFILSVVLFNLITIDSKAADECLALNYHRVRTETWWHKVLSYISPNNEQELYSVTTEEFERQMTWLVKHNAYFVTADELENYFEKENFPKKCVWINFDDIDVSVTNADKVLEKYKIPATGFLITGQIGNKDYLNLELMNFKHLKQLHDTERWEFNSHTHDLHFMNERYSSILNDTKDEILTQDIKKSNQFFKEKFDIENQRLAYPYGYLDGAKVDAIEKANIDYGYTLTEEPISVHGNPYYLPRILVTESSFKKIVEKWSEFND